MTNAELLRLFWGKVFDSETLIDRRGDRVPWIIENEELVGIFTIGALILNRPEPKEGKTST